MAEGFTGCCASDWRTSNSRGDGHAREELKEPSKSTGVLLGVRLVIRMTQHDEFETADSSRKIRKIRIQSDARLILIQQFESARKQKNVHLKRCLQRLRQVEIEIVGNKLGYHWIQRRRKPIHVKEDEGTEVKEVDSTGGAKMASTSSSEERSGEAERDRDRRRT